MMLDPMVFASTGLRYVSPMEPQQRREDWPDVDVVLSMLPLFSTAALSASAQQRARRPDRKCFFVSNTYGLWT